MIESYSANDESERIQKMSKDIKETYDFLVSDYENKDSIRLFKSIAFDDYVVDEDGHQWSQVCVSCIALHQDKLTNLSEAPESGICGIQGCENEADNYVDFGTNVLKIPTN